MGKNKLQRFAELEEFKHVVQPTFDQAFKNDFEYKGNWNRDFFHNNNPMVLELGCGKGEYTVGLARKFPEKNFLGVDIKGARMWRGALDALTNKLPNVGFLRTRIELINSFFGKNEIHEIWITFPDPQLKKRRNKKRLTSSRFLNAYKEFLVPGGIVHLKTDNEEMFTYTRKMAEINNLKILVSTDDLYNSEWIDGILGIKTFYEKQFLSKGLNIHYLSFVLDKKAPIIELPDEE